jgi:hypothetical protein
MKTEKQLQDYTKKLARGFGCNYYKLACVGQTGFPDVLITWKGWSIFIELKSPAGTGVLSARQKYMLKQLTYQEMENYVANQPEQILAIIADLTNRQPRPLHKPLI